MIFFGTINRWGLAPLQGNLVQRVLFAVGDAHVTIDISGCRWMDGWMERRKERNRTNIRCALDFSRLYWDVWIFNGVCLTWPPCCNSDHQSTHKEIALEIQLILSLHGQNTQNPTAKGQLTANHTTSQGSIDNAQLLFFALVGNLWCYFVCFGREFMVFFWWCFACCCERFHICFLFWCFERRETMPNFLV